MRTLKKRVKGKDVERWQQFLRGLNLYLGRVDGDFYTKSYDATIKFQKKHVVPVTGRKRSADGEVGNTTYGIAMTKFCFEVVESDTKDVYGPNWPPKPTNLKSASLSKRQAMFGKFKYKPAPTRSNPEAIKIIDNWQKENLTRVYIPQLVGVRGAPKSGKIFWHKKGADQIVDMFQAWEDAGLDDRILTWAGSWVPRFIRGSRKHLSNHAWATAFDINAPWNGLGRQGALVGDKGCVRELVEIATAHGFWWGGWFRRKDLMHFEMCKLL